MIKVYKQGHSGINNDEHSQLVEVASTHFRSAGLCLQWVVGVVSANVGGPRLCLRRFEARDVVWKWKQKPSETTWKRESFTRWSADRKWSLSDRVAAELVSRSSSVLDFRCTQLCERHRTVQQEPNTLSHDAGRAGCARKPHIWNRHPHGRNHLSKFIIYKLNTMTIILFHNCFFFLMLFHESEIPCQNGTRWHPNIDPSPRRLFTWSCAVCAEKIMKNNKNLTKTQHIQNTIPKCKPCCNSICFSHSQSDYQMVLITSTTLTHTQTPSKGKHLCNFQCFCAVAVKENCKCIGCSAA